jgi:hypothetical protein
VKFVLLIAVLVPGLVPLAAATGQTLLPTAVFDASTTTPTTGGMASVHLTVQSWGIAGERDGKGPDLEIPLKGFYVAHALSGALSATIDGQTTNHLPGDYWTVKLGATMTVKALGEYAMFETIVLAKQ